MRKLITSAFAALAVLGGVAAAVPASAAPAATITGTTSYAGPDSGGAGNYWAEISNDTRVLTVKSLGGGAYTATVSDSGMFTSQLGQLVPNQGASPGVRFITRRHSGTIKGFADYSFTASQAPRVSLIPARYTSAVPSVGTWYEKAFPAGTVFGGTGVTSFGDTYTAADTCVSFIRGYYVVYQVWNDYQSNSDGQGTGGSPAQGGITDLPAAECPA